MVYYLPAIPTKPVCISFSFLFPFFSLFFFLVGVWEVCRYLHKIPTYLVHTYLVGTYTSLYLVGMMHAFSYMYLT